MSEVDHRTVVYQPWTPISDVEKIKVLGKALEETGELISAMARCLIQGVDGKEPVTGKMNKHWLEEEVADVEAMLSHVRDRLNLNGSFIGERSDVKHRRLADWFNNTLNKSLDTLKKAM